MPTYRFITVNASDLGGMPLNKFPVKVEHLNANTSPDGVFFPKRTDLFYSSVAGQLRFKLWCNEEGDTSSLYRFTLPNGDNFDAIVPVGTSDIELSSLRYGANPTSRPQYVSLISRIKSEVSTDVADLIDLSEFYTKTEVNSLIPSPVDLSEFYTKTEVNSLIPSPVDLSEFYTKTEVNSLIPSPVDLSAFYTKTEVDDLIPSPVDLSAFYTKTEVDDLTGNTAKLNVAQQFTATQGITAITLTYAATVMANLNLSNRQRLVLTGNVTTFTASNLREGAFTFIFNQDSNGGKTVVFSSVFKFPGGVAPVLSSTPNAVDILTCDCNGTDLRCVLSGDFK